MKNILYTLVLLTVALSSCKKTTGLVEKNTLTPNKVADSLFVPKASFLLLGTDAPRYLPCTVKATNTSILADSSFWCFVKNGKYVVVSTNRDFVYNYTAAAKDTLVLIVKNKIGQSDTNITKIKTYNDALTHVINILNKPTGAQIKEVTIDALPLTTATKVLVAVYHNGLRIDDSKLSVIGESWEVSTVRSILSASAITNTQLPYKFPFPQNLAPFRLLSVSDVYTFKFYDTDINGTLIDEATIKLENNFTNGVPTATAANPAYLYAQNTSGTAKLKLKITKWY